LVTGVSATGATASAVTGYRGFRLETSGNTGSSTVTATLSLADDVEKFNWCVYAFDYPPNAVLQPDGTYQLHGSPPFTINGDIEKTTNTFGAGTCIESITDLTGNPAGIILMAPVATVSASETVVCFGTEVTFTVTPLDNVDATDAMTYTWDIAHGTCDRFHGARLRFHGA
jgi:hypothetical protein